MSHEETTRTEMAAATDGNGPINNPAKGSVGWRIPRALSALRAEEREKKKELREKMRDGINVVRQERHGDVNALREEMAGLRREQRDGMNVLSQELRAELQSARAAVESLGARLGADIERLRSETREDNREIRQEVRGLTKWAIGTIVIAVLASAGVAITVITFIVNHFT